MSEDSGQQPGDDANQTPPPAPGAPQPAQPQFNPQSGYPVGDQPPPPSYPTPGAAGPYAPYPGPQQGWAPQPGAPQFPVYVLPDHPKATSALVVGIVSVAGLFVCALPILAAPVAWVIGAQARREIRAAPQQWGGESKATAGMVLGIIGTVLLVLALLVIALIIVIAVNDPSAFDSDTSV